MSDHELKNACWMQGDGFIGAPIDAMIDEVVGFRVARHRRPSSICEKEAKNCLLRLFRPLLAEADTRTAAVLVDEFDAGLF
jgi:hypothetical protein